MGAVQLGGRQTNRADCVACLDCAEACPTGAIRLGFAAQAPEFSPARRKFLATLGLGLAGAFVLRVDATQVGVDAHVIRPPGAGSDFAERCVRCGECMRVCPTGAIQPAGFQAGLGAIWTPVLVARIGQCDWTCNACGAVCPTQAIRLLELPIKQSTRIGLAYVDQNRCIPWSEGRECIVCEEMCPLPRKAITLESAPSLRAGITAQVKAPVVDRQVCIGCGICERKCPVGGEAAIRVYSPSQSSQIAG
jgi:MauM/NapG family ferredoxin protein